MEKHTGANQMALKSGSTDKMLSLCIVAEHLQQTCELSASLQQKCELWLSVYSKSVSCL